MNIKSLEKSAKLLKEIQQLDAEIIQIDKFALIAVEGDSKLSFELILKDNPESEKNMSTQSGPILGESIVDYYSRQINTNHFGMLVPTTQKDNNSLSNGLSEEVTLQVLGVLLGDKLRQRETLIKELNILGVKI